MILLIVYEGNGNIKLRILNEYKESCRKSEFFLDFADYLVMSGNTSVIFEWNAARKVFANVSVSKC